tara:strand:+ start:18137 stop:18523 length:387 start_codon:yes stop_codon:yes gene_type:complete
LQTFSTEHFEIRIDRGLLEMRTEDAGLLAMGAGTEHALASMLRIATVRAACFDIRASKRRYSDEELSSRIRQIGRLCRSMPIAFIGRQEQRDQIDAALRRYREMSETTRTFRQRCDARAWLKTAAITR